MAGVDFLVIGSGIAGASVAYELARHGSVLILEAEDQPGYHATGRSASFFFESYGNDTVRALTRSSRRFFESPPAGFADHPLLSERGALTIARPEQVKALEARFDEISPRAPRVRRGDATLALARCPALRSDYVEACLWDPDAREIDVHALLHGYLRLFRRAGGRLAVGERATALERDQGFWRVTTGRAEYVAGVVVNAGGAWADQIAGMAGARPLGLVPLQRTACILDPGDFGVRGWPLVVDIDETFYFKPDAGKLLLSPADETPMDPYDAWPEDRDIAAAVQRLERATRIRVTRRIEHRWAGLRSFFADRTPVVGFDPGIEGFFWLAGQGGYGIQTAPAMGRLAAALAMAGPVPEDLSGEGVTRAALAPGRKALNG